MYRARKKGKVRKMNRNWGQFGIQGKISIKINSYLSSHNNWGVVLLAEYNNSHLSTITTEMVAHYPMSRELNRRMIYAQRTPESGHFPGTFVLYLLHG